MEKPRTNAYTPPVDQLLSYGGAWGFKPEDWPDYLALGIGPEHIPDLIRMATDKELDWLEKDEDEDSFEGWAPIHAWRTLGQLRAEAAIEPLFSLFTGIDQSDWVTEELPEVFAMIGPAALPTLKTAIVDMATDKEIRIDAISCVKRIGIRWPEARPACITLLMEQLEQFTENGPEVNGFLVLALTKLNALEAAPLIEQAFAAQYVDEMIMGDWEDAQVGLGLKSAEEVQQRRLKKHLEMPFPSTVHASTTSEASSKSKHAHEAGHKKAKSKMAKQSRKKIAKGELEFVLLQGSMMCGHTLCERNFFPLFIYDFTVPIGICRFDAIVA